MPKSPVSRTKPECSLIQKLVAGAGCQLDLLITAKGLSASSGTLLYSEGVRPTTAADYTRLESAPASKGVENV